MKFTSILLTSSTLLTISLSTPMLALDANNDWQDILKSKAYLIDERNINFNGQMVNVFNVCLLNDTTLRTINKVNIYEWQEALFEANEPSLSHQDYLSTDIQHTKVYSDYDTSESLENHATSYQIKVMDLNSHLMSNAAFVKRGLCLNVKRLDRYIYTKALSSSAPTE